VHIKSERGLQKGGMLCIFQAHVSLDDVSVYKTPGVRGGQILSFPIITNVTYSQLTQCCGAGAAKSHIFFSGAGAIARFVSGLDPDAQHKLM
jgi:hypothetical protein